MHIGAGHTIVLTVVVAGNTRSRIAADARLGIVAAVSLPWAIVAVAVLNPATQPPTSYAAALVPARAADIAAGVGLVLAGGLAGTQARTRTLGALAMLTGFAWLGADWEAAQDGPALLRSAGALTGPFTLVLVLHLVLSLSDGGRALSRRARTAIAAAYAIAAVVGLGRALFRDPLLDLYCWRSCRDNVFLVHADPGLARALDELWLWSALAIAIGLIAYALHRLLAASGPGRRVLFPVFVPGVLVGAAEAAFAVALLRTPLESPAATGFAAIFIARAVALATLALGVAWSGLRVPRTRARVARLANELGDAPPPGTLREALATALGDPAVDVVYQRGDSDQLIDRDGRPVERPTAGRAVARITRGGRTRALVLQDAALVDEPELQRALGSAARLAVENEALRAEALSRLRELRASRMRIVEVGDAARRRLERNLHDGAQQRLLALSYDLRLARADAVALHDAPLTAALEGAGAETAAALEELRELAHGIYPAILTEAGLAAALATIADEAPLPVVLDEVSSARAPHAVERAAYVIVAEAIDDAVRRASTFLSVRVDDEGDRLVVVCEDDGALRSDELVHLADRVGALGGELEVGDRTLRAEIPCE